MGFKLTRNEDTLVTAAEAQGWAYRFPGVGTFARILFSRDGSIFEISRHTINNRSDDQEPTMQRALHLLTEPRKAAPSPTPNQEGEPVQKQTENEKILTTAAEALCWSHAYVTTPNGKAALKFSRGEGHEFHIPLDTINDYQNDGGVNQDVAHALRMLAEDHSKPANNNDGQTDDSKAICAALGKLTAAYEANNRITQDTADQLGGFFSQLAPAQDPNLERAKGLTEDCAKQLDNNDESELLRYLRLQEKGRNKRLKMVVDSTDYAVKLLAAFAGDVLGLEKKRLKQDKTTQGQTNDALRASIKALCERMEKVEGGNNANISAEYLGLLKESEARTRERIEAVVQTIQGDPEEGASFITNGQLARELADLKTSLDDTHTHELDAIKKELVSIKNHLRTLYDDRT
jgi:hypothetical protein